MSKLWSGRFSKETDELTDEFNASIGFDKKLYREDITASIAHAKMLKKTGILAPETADEIIEGLKGILEDIEEGKIEFSQDLEDIHMNIEQILTDRIGESGKKLHTGRSRNDQVATDFMLFVRRACSEIKKELLTLIDILLNKAVDHQETYMPGYTHLQRAQPINFAHYLLAYIQMFKRDFKRFEFIQNEDLAESPLGSGALAGTTYPLDRTYSAELLEFDRPKANSLDGVSDRDYALDFLQACAVTMMHLSRICEEIILYNSQEFNFIKLDDAFTTGSSIMPQKKNPDLAELIRGKTGRTYGNLISLLTTMKGLPLAYNKDMQEDKEPVFDSYETVLNSLKILGKMLETMSVNKENMKNAAQGGFSNATDLADWLVKNGIPFRDAHSFVGKTVLYCEKNNKNLNELSPEEYKELLPVFDDDLYQAIDLEEIVQKRSLLGGPGKESLKKQIKDTQEFLSLFSY